MLPTSTVSSATPRLRVVLTSRPACGAASTSCPSACRQVFLMSKRDGMTYSEIADELGLSVKTVEHQVSKTLRRLRCDDNDSGNMMFVLLIA